MFKRGIIVFIIMSLCLGIYGYIKSQKLVEAKALNDKMFESIPDGYMMYALKKDLIINYDIETLTNIDIYIINDKLDKSIIEEPVIYNVKVLAYKDISGKVVTKYKDAKYILVAVPNEVHKVLDILELAKSNILIKQSKETGFASVNIKVLDYIMDYYKNNSID